MLNKEWSDGPLKLRTFFGENGRFKSSTISDMHVGKQIYWYIALFRIHICIRFGVCIQRNEQENKHIHACIYASVYKNAPETNRHYILLVGTMCTFILIYLIDLYTHLVMNCCIGTSKWTRTEPKGLPEWLITCTQWLGHEVWSSNPMRSNFLGPRLSVETLVNVPTSSTMLSICRAIYYINFSIIFIITA